MADEEDNARDDALAELEEQRVEVIEQARLYYDGSQFDEENQAADDAAGEGGAPEHRKRLAYSTQVAESIDFVATQLADGFKVTAADGTVQEIVDAVLTGSPDLASDDDEDDIAVTNILRDALVAGDVAVHVRWDPIMQRPWWEFWDSEMVEFRFADDNRFQMEKVLLTQMVWREQDGEMVEMELRKEWSLEDGICVLTTFLDDEKDSGPEPLNIPMVPWRMLRGARKRIRDSRGRSLITTQAMRLADRYNSVEQVSYAIARYNSHGNVAVVGDAAMLQAADDARIRKDVADVLTFPGGTSVESITLPTDPSMIEHQRGVLLDALYAVFGLARLDATTISGWGGVSGYALEILNRKTEGSFEEIRRQFSRDVRSTLNLALDVLAYRSGGEFDAEAEPIELEESALDVIDPDLIDVPDPGGAESVNPDEIFPDRTLKIEMGTGYIVDTVMLRDDYTAGLLSRAAVLRQRGMSPEQIEDIERELDEERGADGGELPIGEAGSRAAAPPSSTQAGSVTGSAESDRAE